MSEQSQTGLNLAVAGVCVLVGAVGLPLVFGSAAAASVISRLNVISRAVLGARLDRGILGIHAASDAVGHERRNRAFGRIVGALIDVALLVLAYWLLGVPVVGALVRATGDGWIGTAALAILSAAVVGVLGAAVLQTRSALAETGGPAWRARATAIAILSLLLLPIVAVAGSASPGPGTACGRGRTRAVACTHSVARGRSGPVVA